MSPAASQPEPTLRRQVAWTLSANAVFGLCNLLVLVVLNKLSDAATVGDFKLALAATAPIFMFGSVRFRTVLATDTRKTVPLRDYFSLRLILLCATLTVATLVSQLPSLLDISVLLIVIASAKAIEGLSDLCTGVQQRIQRIDRVAVSISANGIAMILGFSAVFYMTRNLTMAAVALLASRLMVLACYDLPMARHAAKQPVFSFRADPEIRWRRRRNLFLSALPLGLTASLISLTSNIPLYTIPWILDRERLGLFGSVAVALQAGTLVFRAIEQPAIPRLAAFMDRRDAAGFWRLMGRICSLFLVIGVAGCAFSLCFGSALLKMLFTSEFESLGGVLALMAIAAAITQIAGMVESSLIAARRTTIQVPMHCVTALSCWLLSIVLIERFDLYGAVLAITLCRFPFILIGVWLLRQKLDDEGQTRRAMRRGLFDSIREGREAA